MNQVLSAGAEVALFLFVAVFAIITVALLGAIAFALNKLMKKIDEWAAKAEPVIVKTTDTLDTVQRITMTVGEKADHILTKGEAVADTVSNKVEKTSSVVQSAVTTPLINLSSLITGVSKGFAVWSHATADGRRGNGRSGTAPNVDNDLNS